MCALGNRRYFVQKKLINRKYTHTNTHQYLSILTFHFFSDNFIHSRWCNFFYYMTHSDNISVNIRHTHTHLLNYYYYDDDYITIIIISTQFTGFPLPYIHTHYISWMNLNLMISSCLVRFFLFVRSFVRLFIRFYFISFLFFHSFEKNCFNLGSKFFFCFH